MKQLVLLFVTFLSVQLFAQKSITNKPADGLYTFNAKSISDSTTLQNVKVVINNSIVEVYSKAIYTDSTSITPEEKLYSGILWLNTDNNLWYVVPQSKKINHSIKIDLCAEGSNHRHTKIVFMGL